MFRKIVSFILLAISGVTAFFIFHHPPMHLMPPPLMFQGQSTAVVEAVSSREVGSDIDVFYTTSRLPVGPQKNRIYTVAPDYSLHIGKATVRIGAEGSTLDQIVEWSTRTDKDDRPYLHLEKMNEYATLESNATPKHGSGAEKWLNEINQALEQSRSNDILIYLHGANTTVERATGQASQLRHYSAGNAVVVLFVWPTAENFLRYSRDIRNAIGSAPQVAELIAFLADHTSADNIDVFTYSAGATIGSEALALLAQEQPDVAGRIGEVYHAAPDVDFQEFVNDLGKYSRFARRVSVIANLGDSALRLSGAINRASRAGRPDLQDLDPEAAQQLLRVVSDHELEVIHVTPETLPGSPASSHNFWYDDPWVSNDVLATLLFHLNPAERGLEPRLSESGYKHWSIPLDYPDRLESLRDAQRGVQD